MLKTRYHASLLRNWLNLMDQHYKSDEFVNIDLHDAIYMVTDAWSSIPSQSISNCFAHMGIFTASQEEFLQSTVPHQFNPLEDLSTLLQQLQCTGSSSMKSAKEFAEIDKETLVNDTSEWVDNLDFYIHQ
ncbi:hypothetical protein HK096_010088, partial [Nowakowskiella sp. JEL0078]